MIRPVLHAAGSTLLAFLLTSIAHAQGTGVARSDGFDFSGLDVVTRIVDQTYPMGATPSLSISNRFGPVTVETWEDAVVHLKITIRVGAATEDEAVRTAQLIDVVSVHDKERLDVRTEFPSTEQQTKGGFAVEYAVQTPRQTKLTVDNTFGDTHVIGVRGGTSIDSRYGVIALNDLAGPVRVRARGEFALTAEGLENGGYFFLRGTQASFRDIREMLRVSNYLGTVTLHPMQIEHADIVSENGPIHIYLPDDRNASVEARVDFGRIESEVTLSRDRWGRSEIATYGTPDAPQRIAAHATFDTVYIHRPPSLAPMAAASGDSQLVQDEISQTVELAPNQTIRIDAAPGNVTIEGVADNRVSVVATRRVRIRDIANARLALEGLALKIEDAGPVVRVMTVVREDMSALGSESYGVDLTVKCPVDSTVQVYADKGDLRLERLGGVVQAELGSGALSGTQLSGEATLNALGGSALVADSTGTIALTATGGDARVERVSGEVTVTVQNGKTVIDTPGGGLVVRGTGGDARIVALEGIHGDYDVRVEQGNISLVAPATADATFFLNAENGAVRSAFPVTGTMDRGQYRFQGRLNDGKHRVLLETQNGDIRVD